MTDTTVVRLMTKNLFIVTLLVGTVSPSFAAPPPAPEGYHWVKDDRFTDEFNGVSLDTDKWLDYFPGWRRPAAGEICSVGHCCDQRMPANQRGRFAQAGRSVLHQWRRSALQVRGRTLRLLRGAASKRRRFPCRPHSG